jgi:hypothetical protein
MRSDCETTLGASRSSSWHDSYRQITLKDKQEGSDFFGTFVTSATAHVEAILEGRQPLALKFKNLYNHVPLNWSPSFGVCLSCNES